MSSMYRGLRARLPELDLVVFDGSGLFGYNETRRPTRARDCRVVRRQLRYRPGCAVCTRRGRLALGRPNECEADYQGKVLSAMRYGFGGHLEKGAEK
jgi:hypothetical protein